MKKPTLDVVTLPRLKEGTIYVIFGKEPGAGQQPFGTIYVPAKAAVGLTSISLVLDPTIKLSQEYGAVIGKDVKGNSVHIGDVVNHTRKRELKKGVVLWGHQSYQNEPAARVKSFSSCKSLKALVSSASGYATATSFVIGVVSARSWASCRSMAAVIGIPRQSFDAAIKLA